MTYHFLHTKNHEQNIWKTSTAAAGDCGDGAAATRMHRQRRGWGGRGAAAFFPALCLCLFDVASRGTRAPRPWLLAGGSEGALPRAHCARAVQPAPALALRGAGAAGDAADKPTPDLTHEEAAVLERELDKLRWDALGPRASAVDVLLEELMPGAERLGASTVLKPPTLRGVCAPLQRVH